VPVVEVAVAITVFGVISVEILTVLDLAEEVGAVATTVVEIMLDCMEEAEEVENLMVGLGHMESSR